MPFYRLAKSMAMCHQLLTQEQAANPSIDYDLISGRSDETWCNATWDTVLCWPATRGGASVIQQCPTFPKFDATKNITKKCLDIGVWRGRNETDFTRPSGWTDFGPCIEHNWNKIVNDLTTDGLQSAQLIAQRTRIIEFVGLSLSFMSLMCAIVIFSRFRRLWVFRNLIHLQLMVAIWIVDIIRLVLYVDHAITKTLGAEVTSADVVLGETINSSKYICEFFYALLEYAKTVAFAWMFIEGFNLHQCIVWSVYQSEPKLWKLCIIGWGMPSLHVIIWLSVVVARQEGGISKVSKCLGSYYLQPEFWILNGVRLGELLVNLAFLLNVVRVLWLKLMDSNMGGELSQAKKSVRAALMLLPLLGVPNILQTIQFYPTKDNLPLFATFTYVAAFTYMYQGFFVAMLYCFTNREVLTVLKLHWERFLLRHRSAEYFRRGSRARPRMRPSAVEMFQYQGNGTELRPTFNSTESPVMNWCSSGQRDSADSARALLASPEFDRANLSNRISNATQVTVDASRKPTLVEDSPLLQNGNVFL